jgi:poly(hydroxyalkanoate) granule-associated protein
MMVKKLKSEAEDKQLANAVRTSAQQIWQAGLGAFAKAQEEGGRVFSKLVKEGTELQKRTQKRAESKASDMGDTVSRMADEVGKQASGSWDKLEQVFEERVARALSSIGVPTQGDIDDLNGRIDQLSKLVAQLSSAQAAPIPTKVVARATVKRAAKPDVEDVANKEPTIKTPVVKKPAIRKPALKKPATAAPASEGNGGATKAATAKPAAKSIFPTAASRAAAVKSAAKQVAK